MVPRPLHRRREAPHEFIWRLPDGADFARSCDPSVGLLVDSWHWHHAGGTVEEIIELGMRSTMYTGPTQLTVPLAPYAMPSLLPGEGVVDHQSFLAALTEVGYFRFISPEVRGYSCSSAAEDCAQAAFHAVRECLNAASHR